MKYNSKAVRLADVIVQDIWSGNYDRGKYLPGEDALAENYQVSRTTIRRVLDILNKEGVLIKEPNRGTLINPDLKQQTAKPATTGKTVTIGAIWAGFPDAMTIGIADGIKAFASEKKMGFQLFQSTEGHAKVLDYLLHIDELGVAGVILLPYNFPGYALHRGGQRRRCLPRGGENAGCLPPPSPLSGGAAGEPDPAAALSGLPPRDE